MYQTHTSYLKFRDMLWLDFCWIFSFINYIKDVIVLLFFLSFLRDSQQFLLFPFSLLDEDHSLLAVDSNLLRMVSRRSSNFSNKINYTEVTASMLTCFDGNFFYCCWCEKGQRAKSWRLMLRGTWMSVFKAIVSKLLEYFTPKQHVALKTSNRTDGPPDWHHHP